MIVHIVRFLSVAIGALSGYAASQLIDWTEQTGFSHYSVIVIFVILGWSVGYIVGGIMGRELAIAFARLEERLRSYTAVDIAMSATGLLVGLLIALIISVPLRLLRPEWLGLTLTGSAFVVLSYFGVRVALIKRGDLAHIVPAAPGAGAVSVRTLLLDTSAVIDGRFAELRNLGFLEGDLRVPRFVLAELQTLADSADDTRRARGRRGLDTLTRLQSSGMGVTAFEADVPEVADVDGKLMALAREMDASIITVDYNLTKVARVRELQVLNLNDAANALKPAYLPGEALRVHIGKPGKEAGQGVGYLQDGTMVVVHGAAEHVGSDADTEVTSVLQTSAGRMIFARFVSAADSDEE